MKTVGAPVSSLEEAREKIQEVLGIASEVMSRLLAHEEQALRADVIMAAHAVEDAKTSEQLCCALCQAIHAFAVHLRSCHDLSHVGRAFVRWLDNVEGKLIRFEKNHPKDWLPFLQKWPRLWKASLLSLLGLFDMGVWVGEAIERTISSVDNTSEKEKAAWLRRWKRVEEAIDAKTFSTLKMVLGRARREREWDVLKKLHREEGEGIALASFDVGYAERQIGLEEFLLKIMIEMAAKTIQEGGRAATGERAFGCLQKLITEHIAIIGDKAAEASAMNLVLETVKAEEAYFVLRRRWKKGYQKDMHDKVRMAQKNREYHEVHCAIIDAYMELSDCKSLRGVMLCYEVPIFTQLLYDQRRRLDEELKEAVKKSRREKPASALCG